MKRAYPQWFDQNVGKDSLESTNYYDCSSAISRAARMKSAGEVFLPEGYYFIKHPIKLPYGIKLIGDGCSHAKADDNSDFVLRGTVIIPYASPFTTQIGEIIATDLKWQGKAFVEINYNESAGKNDEDWEVGYPRSFGMLCNLTFYNKRNRHVNITIPITQEMERERLSNVPCCYVAGSFTFQNLAFHGFRCGIKWSSNCYSDLKYVRNCSFFNDAKLITKPMKSDTPVYAIDTGFLGDAMIIERCHVQGYLISETGDGNENRVKLFNALKSTACMGGTISNNIFNSDVHLLQCLATVFEANTMGDGAQLMLSGCDMSVRNNYFDKVKEPSIVVCLDALYSAQGNIKEYQDSNLIISGNSFMVRPYYKKSDGMVVKRFPAGELCEFDIALNRNSYSPYTINLSQNYRYVNYDSRCNQPTGIMFATFYRPGGSKVVEYKSFEKFNKRSYYLSTKSQIMPDLNILATCAFNEVPTLATSDNTDTTISVFQTKAIQGEFSGTAEQATSSLSWRYQYKAQLIMDAKRGIKSDVFDVKIRNVDSSIGGFDPQYGQVFEITYTPPKSCCILKLYRYIEFLQNNVPVSGILVKNAEVEVPVVGTLYLYDNNVNINGYKWNTEQSTFDEEMAEITKGSMLEFLNDNVKYFLKENVLPGVSKWEEHDEVIMPDGKVYFRIGDQWIKIN